MTQIKFRAWVTQYADEETIGYMLDLPLNKLQFDCEDGFVLAFGGYGFWGCECYENRKPKFEVMEFSGIKDKNKKDVYEGDILRCIYSPHKYVVKKGYCQLHQFTGWYADVDNGFIQSTINNDSDSDFNSSFEVIGNIYETPELSKQ